MSQLLAEKVRVSYDKLHSQGTTDPDTMATISGTGTPGGKKEKKKRAAAAADEGGAVGGREAPVTPENTPENTHRGRPRKKAPSPDPLEDWENMNLDDLEAIRVQEEAEWDKAALRVEREQKLQEILEIRKARAKALKIERRVQKARQELEKSSSSSAEDVIEVSPAKPKKKNTKRAALKERLESLTPKSLKRAKLADVRVKAGKAKKKIRKSPERRVFVNDTDMDEALKQLEKHKEVEKRRLREAQEAEREEMKRLKRLKKQKEQSAQSMKEKRRKKIKKTRREPEPETESDDQTSSDDEFEDTDSMSESDKGKGKIKSGRLNQMGDKVKKQLKCPQDNLEFSYVMSHKFKFEELPLELFFGGGSSRLFWTVKMMWNAKPASSYYRKLPTGCTKLGVIWNRRGGSILPSFP